MRDIFKALPTAKTVSYRSTVVKHPVVLCDALCIEPSHDITLQMGLRTGAE